MKKYFSLLITMVCLLFSGMAEAIYPHATVNFVASALAKAQAILLDNFQKPELRFTDPAVYRLFLSQGPLMFPDYADLRKREDRTVEAYYRKRTSRSLSTGRSHGHTGATGDSAVLTPSWTTYSDTFAISLKQADNNIFNAGQMLANEFENLFKNFIEGNETNATVYLNTNRSHVNAAAFGNPNDDLGTFNSSTFVHEIPASTYWGQNNFNTMFAMAIKTVMQVNKYSGFSIVCDSVAWAKLQYIAAQGKDNSNNLEFTLNGITYYHALKLNALAVALGYTEGYAIAIPDGTIGCLPWIPKQNRQGYDSKIQTYANMINPYDDQTYAIHYYPVRADGTSTGGYTQDEDIEYEGSLDLAFEHAPLSTAGETPLFAFAISGSIT